MDQQYYQTDENELISCFAGKNYEYYKRKWDELSVKRGKFSFNIPAIILGPIWFAYRKMYLYMIAFYAPLSLLGILFAIFNIKAPSSVFTVAGILIGMYANSLYLFFVKKKIGTIRKKTSDEVMVRDIVEKQGGVSIAGAAILTGITILYIIFIVIDMINNGLKTAE